MTDHSIDPLLQQPALLLPTGRQLCDSDQRCNAQVPPVLELKPSHPTVQYQADRDQAPVRSEIRPQERLPEPEEQCAKSGRHWNHNEVGSKRPPPSPPTSPGVDE
jgi:hypothetical protein